MSSVSRRRFLEDSLFATAAAMTAGSATGLVTAPAWAAEPEQQSTSPNEKLSVAVIGVKGRGGSHLDAFAGRKDTEVTVICDVDREVGMKQCEAVAKKQGRAPKYVEDLRQVFDDKSIDFVSTATPNHWHALCAVWAVQAGKDVYVEKPVSHNVWEGRQIVSAARKHNKIVQTGTQCRSSKGMHDCMEFLKSGKIGEVKLARGLCYKSRGSIGPRGDYKVPASVNYDLWSGPAPVLPLTRQKLHYDWHWQWPYGNGDLGNQGIHQMDVARWGLGVQDLGKSVLSYGCRLGYVDAGDTANTQVSVHDYGDKTLVFEVRGLSTKEYQGAKVGVIFTGSDGFVVMTTYSDGVAFTKNGDVITKFGGGGNHFGNFVQAVRSRKHTDLHADIEEGHLSSALCHLGNISYRLGTSVPLTEAAAHLTAAQLTAPEHLETLERFTSHLADNKLKPEETKITFGPRLTLAGETFTGARSAEANPMLTREYRGPFVVPAIS